MKINKNSWHYKLYRHVGGSKVVTSNLCSYFWAVAFSLFLWTVVVFAACGMTYVLVDVARMLAHQLHWWALLVPVGVLAMLVGLFLLVELPGSDTGKLIGAFIKAKTKGICPTVEFTDDK